MYEEYPTLAGGRMALSGPDSDGDFRFEEEAPIFYMGKDMAIKVARDILKAAGVEWTLLYPREAEVVRDAMSYGIGGLEPDRWAFAQRVFHRLGGPD